MNHWEPPCVILPKKKPHPACPVDAHRTGRVALPDGQPIQGAVPRCRCLPLCQRREKSWADENQSLSSTRYWGGIPVSIDVTSTLNAAVFCIFTASPVCCYVNGHVSSRLRGFRTLLGGSFWDLVAPVRIPLVLCRAKIKSLYLRFAVFGGNLYGLFVCGQHSRLVRFWVASQSCTGPKIRTHLSASVSVTGLHTPASPPVRLVERRTTASAFVRPAFCGFQACPLLTPSLHQTHPHCHSFS
ncbi:hypothetical protein QBC37DRAFT_160215 [Rhypophila decipiens]|uniref:Uncharacterized protein n=1 Tax=Rhypophila decipiens TaxID=261697 RepID=A0AAN7BAM2_9PEZI|nr:hypothetical protein QBC37DRAFT_160215 [Rhypophila decipiens]